MVLGEQNPKHNSAEHVEQKYGITLLCFPKYVKIKNTCPERPFFLCADRPITAELCHIAWRDAR